MDYAISTGDSGVIFIMIMSHAQRLIKERILEVSCQPELVIEEPYVLGPLASVTH